MFFPARWRFLCSLGAAETASENDAAAADADALVIADQGIFSAGGTVTQSDGTFDVANYYTSRAGSTSHVDHANVLYQIPADASGAAHGVSSTATANPAWAG